MNKSLRDAALRLAQIAQQVGLPAQFTARAADDLAAIQQQLDLPAFLVEWYTIAAPQDVEIPTLGNPQWLEPAENLADALLGYRYHAHSGEALAGWDATWLVLGGEPEYPLIVRTAAAHDPTIYHGRPGEATWDLRPLSSDLEGFLAGVADYLWLYVGRYQQTVHDARYVLDPTFRAELVAALSQRSSTAPYVHTWMRDWLGLETGITA